MKRHDVIRVLRTVTTRGRLAQATAAVAALALLSGGASIATAHASASRPMHRGALLSVTEISHLTPTEVQAAVGPFFGETGRVRYAVTGYRITYATVDVQGRPTVASGLVVLPDGAPHVLRVVCYDHGTNPTRDAVASVAAGGGDREAAELFASAGYAAVAPDYLGLGVGPGTHPYMDTSSEVTATVDMLNSARAFAARQGVSFDPRLLVTGFSQGGPAAMATARAVQNGQAGPGWRLGALAPVSGPYDVEHAEIPALLGNKLDPESAVLYISYWTVAMNRIHHLYDNPDEVFQQPYAGFVEGLYDGDHSEQAILSALPGTVDQLLTPRYLAWLKRPSGTLLEAMRKSDTSCQWRPDIPVELYAAHGDKGVVIANSEHCRTQLAQRGTDVQLVDVGNVDHNHSVMLAVPEILTYFVRMHSR